MKVCPRCGESQQDDARFCPNDGVQLDASADPYIGKSCLGQFEILEVCGVGSMGTVYRAWQANMEREVAIKILRRNLLRDPRVVKRFHREARAAARLSHPNIITVHLVGETDDGVPLLVMEYVRGTGLDRICAEESPLPAARAINIAVQICAALGEAHSHGIVHRDLKPENIIVAARRSAPDFVKVLDFGIAKIVRGTDESRLTQTGAIFGTPHYIAPEQAAGGDVDHRCDLYSLGVILFRLVTGQLPFQSTSGMAVLVQHLKEKPPLPRDVNRAVTRELEEVILRSLEKTREQRFQSAEELADALRGVLDGLAGSTLDQRNERYSPQQTLLPASGARASADESSRVPSTVVPGAVIAPARRHDSFQLHGNSSDPVPPLVSLADTGLETDLERDAAGTTVNLAASIFGRRRLLAHLLVAVLALAAGGSLGAFLHWRAARAATPSPLASPPAQRPAETAKQQASSDEEPPAMPVASGEPEQSSDESAAAPSDPEARPAPTPDEVDWAGRDEQVAEGAARTPAVQSAAAPDSADDPGKARRSASNRRTVAGPARPASSRRASSRPLSTAAKTASKRTAERRASRRVRAAAEPPEMTVRSALEPVGPAPSVDGTGHDAPPPREERPSPPQTDHAPPPQQPPTAEDQPAEPRLEPARPNRPPPQPEPEPPPEADPEYEVIYDLPE